MKIEVTARVSYRAGPSVRRLVYVSGMGDTAAEALAVFASRLHSLIDEDAVPTGGRTVNLAEIEGSVSKWVD